jgi:hypothetical protein
VPLKSRILPETTPRQLLQNAIRVIQISNADV